MAPKYPWSTNSNTLGLNQTPILPSINPNTQAIAANRPYTGGFGSAKVAALKANRSPLDSAQYTVNATDFTPTPTEQPTSLSPWEQAQADALNVSNIIGGVGLGIGAVSSLANYNLQTKQFDEQKAQFQDNYGLAKDNRDIASSRLDLAYANSGRTRSASPYNTSAASRTVDSPVASNFLSSVGY